MIDDTPKGSGLANLLTLPEALWKSMLTGNDADTSHHEAARIGLLTIGMIILWTKFAPRTAAIDSSRASGRDVRRDTGDSPGSTDQPRVRPR